MRHLQVNLVAELVLVPEDGVSGADVRKVGASVGLRNVREPQVSLRIERHSRVVDGSELSLVALQHPVDFRFGVAVGGFAGELERLSLVSLDELLALCFFEGVEFRSAYEDGVGGGRAPLVEGEALVLAEVLVARLADHERPSPRLLRDTVVVARVFECLAVLYPSVSVDRIDVYNHITHTNQTNVLNAKFCLDG